MNKDVLFIAAAGNGHQGIGYDNDTELSPVYPQAMLFRISLALRLSIRTGILLPSQIGDTKLFTSELRA